jgi:dihydrofolate reductase
MESEGHTVWDNIFTEGGRIFERPHRGLFLLIEQMRALQVRKVLDIGSGTGRHLVFFASLGFETYGIDNSPEAVKQARKWLSEQNLSMDPEIDFGAFFSQFDTIAMGRRTFEVIAAPGKSYGTPGIRTFVFSTTLEQRDYPKVTIVSENAMETLKGLRAEPGKDIWLFGGGVLFRNLLAAGLVDSVEVAVMPVLLGGGIPLLSPPGPRAGLKLTGHKVYSTGIVSLEYSVNQSSPLNKSFQR